jgi:hypothetical protein
VPPLAAIPSPPLNKRVQSTVDAMRQSGAPEEDIRAFIDEQTEKHA